MRFRTKTVRIRTPFTPFPNRSRLESAAKSGKRFHNRPIFDNFAGKEQNMQTILYLLRHGETIENANGIFQGQTPGHLSEKGRIQAAAMRSEVARLHFDAVLCSDLQRCKDTAGIVLSGTEITPLYTTLLRERYMGYLVGKPIAGAQFDDSVENAEQVGQRARQLLRIIQEKYAGKSLLIISHGYFLQIFQAIIENKKREEVSSIGNCEIRKINFSY